MSCRDFEKFSKIQHFWKRNTSAYFCIPLMCHIIHIMSSCFSDNIKQNPRKMEASIMPCILCNNDSLHFYSTFIFCTVDFVWFSLFLSCSTFWLLQNQKRMHFLWPDPSTMFFHIRPEYPHKRAFHPYYKYMFLLFASFRIEADQRVLNISLKVPFQFNVYTSGSLPDFKSGSFPSSFSVIP